MILSNNNLKTEEKHIRGKGRTASLNLVLLGKILVEVTKRPVTAPKAEDRCRHCAIPPPDRGVVNN